MLVEQQVGQLRVERLRILFGGEVAAFPSPPGQGVCDPGDQLLDASLAPGVVQVAPEVLGNHDLGGLLAPEGGDLDVLLLEHDLAALTCDGGGAKLPFDFVVGVDPGTGKAAGKAEAGRGFRRAARAAPG
jgi:hypothetical protein